MSEQVAFIDTETTGLDPGLNPIWEIAVIVDGVEHCWRQQTPLMQIVDDSDPKPTGPYVSRWVMENTRFGEFVYDQAGALLPEESTRRFAGLVEGRHLVGAVPSFDEERLRLQYDFWLGKPSRYPWHYHLIDVEALAVGYLAAQNKRTRELTRGMAPEVEAKYATNLALPWDSDDLSRFIGVEPPSEADRHTALADARWAKAIYEAIVGPISTTEEPTE